jgi:chemotaxis protein histidine kinase CheA
MEDALLALEGNRRSTDLVNALFRGLHNLKGNAGVLLSEKTQAISKRSARPGRRKCCPMFHPSTR